MKKATTSHILKSINEQKVLRLIHIEGPISRVEIARRTQLTQQTITNIVKRFLDQNIVLEMGTGENASGRKPIQLEINDQKMLGIGVSITKKSVTAVLMDFRKKEIQRHSSELSKASEVKQPIDSIFECVDAVIQSVPENGEIKGIGCSIQGLVDSKEGIVISSPVVPWENFPLKERMEYRYNIPVNLENDVNLIALEENLNGVLKDARHSVVFNFDYGIGGAIVFDNQLYEGASFVAGELGHYKAFSGEESHPCHCGKDGCLTTLASIRGLEQNTPYMIGQLSDLLKQNNPQARHLFRTIKDAIVESISNIIIFFNPDNILITGRFIRDLQDYLLPDLQARIMDLLPLSCKKVTFNYNLNDIDKPTVAMSLAMDHFFHIPLGDLSLQFPAKI